MRPPHNRERNCAFKRTLVRLLRNVNQMLPNLRQGLIIRVFRIGKWYHLMVSMLVWSLNKEVLMRLIRINNHNVKITLWMNVRQIYKKTRPSMVCRIRNHSEWWKIIGSRMSNRKEFKWQRATTAHSVLALLID